MITTSGSSESSDKPLAGEWVTARQRIGWGRQEWGIGLPERTPVTKLDQIRIDSRNKPFRSGPHSSESNGGNKEGRAYQDTECAPDERISMLNPEHTSGIAWLCVNKGDEPVSRRVEGLDNKT